MLSRLVYCSEVTDLGSGGTQAILDEARRQNAPNDVTGLLLYSEHRFLQCLEGGRAQVTETFCRIAGDHRHTGVQLMSVSDVQERYFTDWTMGYVQSTPELRAILRRAMPTGDFEPAGMTEQSVDALITRLHELYSGT